MSKPLQRDIQAPSISGKDIVVSVWRDGEVAGIRMTRAEDGAIYADATLSSEATYELADALSRILIAIEDDQRPGRPPNMEALLP